MRPTIEINIDRLELHGYDPKTGRLIGAALEQHLGELIRQHGLSNNNIRPATIRTLNAGQLSRKAESPRAIGNNIALNIYKNLGL